MLVLLTALCCTPQASCELTWQPFPLVRGLLAVQYLHQLIRWSKAHLRQQAAQTSAALMLYAMRRRRQPVLEAGCSSSSSKVANQDRFITDWPVRITVASYPEMMVEPAVSLIIAGCLCYVCSWMAHLPALLVASSCVCYVWQFTGMALQHGIQLPLQCRPWQAAHCAYQYCTAQEQVMMSWRTLPTTQPSQPGSRNCWTTPLS